MSAWTYNKKSKGIFSALRGGEMWRRKTPEGQVLCWLISDLVTYTQICQEHFSMCCAITRKQLEIMCRRGIYISSDFSTMLLCLVQVYNLLASLGSVSLRRIFLSYPLNIQGYPVHDLWVVEAYICLLCMVFWQEPHIQVKHTHTHTPHNILSKFVILCWAAFTATLGYMWPMGCGSDTLDLKGQSTKQYLMAW